MKSFYQPVRVAPLVLVGAALAIASSGRAQVPGGGGDPSAQAPAAAAPAAPSGGAPSGGGGFSQGGAAAAPSAPSGGGPTSRYGLIPRDAPPLIELGEAMTRATENNFDLRIANEKVVQQEAQVRKAWALLLPNVSLGGSYTYNYPEQTVAFGDEEQFRQQALLYSNLANIVEQSAAVQTDPQARRESQESAAQLRAVATQLENQKAADIVVQPAHLLGAQATFNMPLFNGRAIPLLQNAYDAVDVVELSNRQARAAIMLAVAQAYYGAVTAQELVQLSQKQLENSERHRTAVKDRVELGVATPLVLARAELDVARAEQQVRTSRNALQSALGALGFLVGEEEEFAVTAPDAIAAVELEKEPDLVSRAVSSRIDLKIQKAALTIADRNRTDAWMMFLPSVNLTAQGRYTSNTSGFTSQPVTGALIISAQVPLYDGGQRYAALRESASKIREELLKVRKAESEIARQVRGNIADIHVKREGVVASERSLALAKDAAANAEALYEVGVATDLDVTDANLAVFLSEVDLLRQRLDLEQSRLGLLYVLGEFPEGVDAKPREISEKETDQARALMDKVDASAD